MMGGAHPRQLQGQTGQAGIATHTLAMTGRAGSAARAGKAGSPAMACLAGRPAIAGIAGRAVMAGRQGYLHSS